MADTNISIHQGGDANPFIFGAMGANGTAFAVSTPTAFSSAGFTAKEIATGDFEPEIFQTAINGDGQVEQIAETTAANRMGKFQLTGYITTSFDPSLIPNTATLVFPGEAQVSIFVFVKKVGNPYKKGAFQEVALDLESYPLVTS